VRDGIEEKGDGYYKRNKKADVREWGNRGLGIRKQGKDGGEGREAVGEEREDRRQGWFESEANRLDRGSQKEKRKKRRVETEEMP